MKTRMQTMIVGLLGLVLYAGPLSANGMQAYFADFTNPALLSDVDSASAAVTVPPAYVACASQPPNVVFGVNFTSGLAYRDGILYGLEWENGNGPAIFLYRFAADNCATGTRVGGATGHANLESLAYCEADGFFYSVDFAFEAPHQGQLVRIDPATGAGTLVGGHMASDVRIVGMVCGPQGQLWAVSSGFATRNAELLKIDRSTGVEMRVGELGLPPNEVESLAIDPDKPGQLFSAGRALYEVNKSTGAAVLVGGSFNQVWSMAGVPASSTFQINAGHTGAWYNPETPGQGQLIDVEPESQFMFLAWFTFTNTPPDIPDVPDNPNELHWFTAQGNYTGNTANLTVFETLGGRFDDPQAVTTEPIGGATLSFDDCGAGQLDYTIGSWDLEGSFPVRRAIPGAENVCEEEAGNTEGALVVNDGRDGAWYDPDAPGQGFLIDVQPNPEGDDFIFVAWFTYGEETVSGQHWYTAQGNFAGSTADIILYETTGGRFDDPQATTTGPVGSLAVDFTDCENALLTYSLTEENLEGAIDVTRAVPGTGALCERLSVEAE